MRSNPQKMAQIQLEYFENKIGKLMDKLPNNCEDPMKYLKKALQTWKRKDSIEKLTLREVTTIETLNFIRKLSNYTAHGTDKISAMMIKAAAGSLTEPIRYLINKSIRDCRYPAKWKTSRVIPLHKGKNANVHEPGSYRPISLLPVVSKIVDRAIQAQITGYMDKTCQTNPNQHLYRSGHSTMTSLLQLSDIFFRACDEKQIATAMSIDETSAFDCVDHLILIEKLKLYNFGENCIKWILDYLTYRSQFVTIGNKNSTTRPVKQGVPQGSVLGPILFTIYTNELPEIPREDDCRSDEHKIEDDRKNLFNKSWRKCGLVMCYADDTTYVATDKDRNTIQEKLRNNLEKIRRHLNANKLTINMGKTTLLETMLKQKRCRMDNRTPTLNVTDDRGQPKEIKVSEYCRLLGGNFSNNLEWKSQLESGEKSVLPGVRSKLGALRHVADEIPEKGRKLLTEGIIISRLAYLIPVWGGAPKKYIKKVQVLLNKAARLVLKAGRMTSSKKLMMETGWLSAQEMVDYHTLLTTWRVVRQGVPQYLSSKMTIDDDDLIDTTRARLKTTKNSYRWRGTTTWNSLPAEVRAAPSLANFNKSLKNG